MAIVAEQVAVALMNEEQEIAVPVPGEIGHVFGTTPEAHPRLGSLQQQGRGKGQGVGVFQLRRVEGPRPKRSVEARPTRRWVGMDHVRRRTRKTGAADFAFVVPVRQVDMGLPRDRP